MKSMNNNNWLGFSLSPHLNMEVSSEPNHHPNHQSHHHQAQPTPPPVSNAVQNSFLSPTHLNAPGICYEGENGGLYSQLSTMPLKSDGSLCIMEALSRSQNRGMVASPSPKLEDFLGCGGPNMGAHHQYRNNDREATTMYYHQIQEPEANRNHPLDLLQEPFRQQPYFQPLQEGMVSGLTTGHHQMYHTPLEEPMADDDGFPSLKNWVARHYNDMEGGMGSGSSVGGIGYGDLHSLSLSMSPGSQSSCVTAPQHISNGGISDCIALDVAKKRGSGKGGQKQPVHRKSIDTFGQRTSQYRGVTRHRWTGRYEAHLWDNSCKKEGQTRKGRQVYLGGYDMEEKAARTYDLAALKYWGPSTHINFPLENYHEELEEMKNMSRQEYVAHLRRKSSGFSRGASMYRGVTRHHQHGRWQARIGRVAGNKDLYLGTFSTQEEAAEAYDIAAIRFRGVIAVTNFDITRYDVERIMASSTLLSGELARRTKAIEAGNEAPSAHNSSRELDSAEENISSGSDWKRVLYQPPNQTPPPSKSPDHNKPISVAFHGLVGAGSMSLAQGVDEPGKMASTHQSNPSSLVTSLSSSREGSPDQTGLSMAYSKNQSKFTSTTTPMGPWVPSAQLRPAISMAHMQVFAAWSDA